MDNLLGNSFFYFFSATPQVLGGILALFGVFVIFKVKTIRDELTGIGGMLYKEANDAVLERNVKLSKKLPDKLILEKIEMSLAMQNFGELNEALKSIESFENPDSLTTKYPNPLIQRNKFCAVFKFLQKLIRQTICWSAITACIIIICLSALPFYNLILNHHCLRNSFFAFIIISISIIFIYLILILRTSLKETFDTIYPNPK